MTDRIFSPCCYGSEQQHMEGRPCPQDTCASRARLKLADVLDLAGYAEDAEFLRKPTRIGGMSVPYEVAVAAMLAFTGASA